MCSHPACDLIATDVDHVTPHRGDDRLRLDPDNLQSLCHGHHSSKTVAQDGGLGRQRETISVGHIWPALQRIDEQARVVIEPRILGPQITYIDWKDEEPSL